MTPASSPPLAERVVALNGTRSSLGQRILEALSVRPEIDRIVPIDRPATLSNLKDLVEGVTDLVVLAPGGGAGADGSMLGEVDLDGARRLLSAVDAAELDHMVVVSSAMVYGAWADNAVPVTEAAVLRPNPSCSLARDKAELERLAGEWRSGRTGRSLAIVRPALVVAGDVASVEWMERSLWGAGWTGRRTADVPRQFLLVDDLVDAIVRLVIANDANGAFNVAPDGWINADRQRELTGRFGTPGLSAPTAGVLASLRWKFGFASTPPEILPYTAAPWVVSNDRLRGIGWLATHTNDEAFIIGSRATWWSTLTARRRQDVALGALVGGVGGLTALLVLLVRSLRRAAASRE